MHVYGVPEGKVAERMRRLEVLLWVEEGYVCDFSREVVAFRDNASVAVRSAHHGIDAGLTILNYCKIISLSYFIRFSGAKGIAVLHHLPIFRQFFHFHKNPSSSIISGTFPREVTF